MNGSEALVELLSFLGMPCASCGLPALWKKDTALYCDGCVPRVTGEIPADCEPLSHASAVGALRAALRGQPPANASVAAAPSGTVHTFPARARATAGTCACGAPATWRVPGDAVRGVVERFYCDTDRPTSGPDLALLKAIRAPKPVAGPVASVIRLPVPEIPAASASTPEEREALIGSILRGIERVRGSRRSLTSVEIRDHADAELRADLEKLTRVGRGGAISSVMLGHMLRRIADVKVGSMQLVRDTKVQGFVLWKVKCDAPVKRERDGALSAEAILALRDIEGGRNLDPTRSTGGQESLVRASRATLRALATAGWIWLDGTDASWHLTETGREQLAKASA